MTGRRAGAVGAGVALVGLAIASYLTAIRIGGEVPACGPFHGCDTVAASEYSELAGIPVALLGVLYSGLILALDLAWWRRGARRALLAAYGLGLFASIFIVYLTYLELFVIHAVCAWCVAYGATVIVGWVIAALAAREPKVRPA